MEIISFSFFCFIRLEQELRKLRDFRNSIADENEKYLKKHPEFRKLIDEFVTAVFHHKPKDVVQFGVEYWNTIYKHQNFGPCPVVIAGPSGVGKDSLIHRLLEIYPHLFGFSVSRTTRPPRPDEVDGVHYHFVSKPEFEESIERHEFIEYAKVHNHYYGTTFQGVEQVWSFGSSLFSR